MDLYNPDAVAGVLDVLVLEIRGRLGGRRPRQRLSVKVKPPFKGSSRGLCLFSSPRAAPDAELPG